MIYALLFGYLFLRCSGRLGTVTPNNSIAVEIYNPIRGVWFSKITTTDLPNCIVAFVYKSTYYEWTAIKNSVSIIFLI